MAPKLFLHRPFPGKIFGQPGACTVASVSWSRRESISEVRRPLEYLGLAAAAAQREPPQRLRPQAAAVAQVEPGAEIASVFQGEIVDRRVTFASEHVDFVPFVRLGDVLQG